MINICQCCHVEFKAERKQKYCSSDCFGMSHRTRMMKPCKQCGKDFESEPHKQRLFCSRECACIYKRKEKLILHCNNCGKEFSCRSCVPDTKYCSKSCAAVHKRAREIRKCQVCQNDFYPAK